MARLAISVLTALLSLTFCLPGTASADWARRFAGPPGVDASPTGIGTDSAGNVYVAGRFGVNSTEPTYVLIKYDANGVRKWLRRRLGFRTPSFLPIMTVDRNGNVFLLGSVLDRNTMIMTTRKYDSDGNQEWCGHFSYYGSDIYPASITVDGTGVYVSAELDRFNGEYTDHGILTIKYDNTGKIEWTAVNNGPKGTRLTPTKIAVDGQGNVYVGGASSGYADGTYRLVAIKYDPKGTLQWKRVCRKVEPASMNLMGVDLSGNVYLSGQSLGASGSLDVVTLKYDTFGTRQWTRRYNGPDDLNERPRDMTMDKDGNVYITGISFAEPYIVCKTFAIKYNTSGVRQWIYTYDGGEYHQLPVAHITAVDGDGNVYLNTSDFNDLHASGEIATVKINSDGVQQWVKTFNGNAYLSECGEGIALGENGDVNVIGESTGTDGSYDIVTINYEQ